MFQLFFYQWIRNVRVVQESERRSVREFLNDSQDVFINDKLILVEINVVLVLTRMIDEGFKRVKNEGVQGYDWLNVK